MDETLTIKVTPEMQELIDRLELYNRPFPKLKKKVWEDSYYERYSDLTVPHWPISDEYEWQTNIGNGEAYRWQQRGFVISTPKATPQCSVEQLLAMNLSGVYLHKPTSIKGIWPILMPNTQPTAPEWPGEYFEEYMPIPEKLPLISRERIEPYIKMSNLSSKIDFTKFENIDFVKIIKKYLPEPEEEGK